MRLRLCLVWLFAAGALASTTHAQPALRALDAVWLTPRLLPARDQLLLSASAGYGLTGDVASTGGVHHRVAGSLAVALASRTGLAAELRLDGRLDEHHVPKHDDSLVGDPRLFLRYGRAVHTRARLGVELGLWTPGRSAPSIDLRATSVDLLLAGDFKLASWLSLAAASGPRFDQSAHSVNRAVVLSRSDQISLGVSQYDAWLSRLAASTVVRDYTVSAELSADSLFGHGAPHLRDSPWRAALVGRRAFGKTQQLELTATVATLLSGRPTFGPDRYVPFEPRFQAFLGARFLFDRPGQTQRAAPPVEPPPGAVAAAVPESIPETGTLLIHVRDEDQQPLPDVAVMLGELELRTGGAGLARFADVPVGAHELRVSGSGFVTAVVQTLVTRAATAEVQITMVADRSESLLRVQVRDQQSGEPLVAACTLEAGPRKRTRERFVTHADGSFELALPEGRYRVSVSAAGYHTQMRAVEVRPLGVTLFNIDLAQELP